MKCQWSSIIIPCYNYGMYLPETMLNVLQQSYTNWECIIVDDGSTDDTQYIVEQFAQEDCRFVYIYQAKSGILCCKKQRTFYG